jgi:hypothetical protein
MTRADDVSAEMARAEARLRSLVGEELSTITITSETPDEAVFLGQNISKLSPIIGNLVERRITHLLTERDAEHGMRWQRQDPNFPDALLVDAEGKSTDSGFEVKAWYVLSTELTGRFRESANLLAGKDIRVVVVAWTMSHVIYGRPQIVDVLVVDALSVASVRDAHYHKPPDYLCEEPQDTTARTVNLRQTSVNGYKLQAESQRGALQRMVDASGSVGKASHRPESQALVKKLMASAQYRLDTNFAKIDRIDHPNIESFKSAVLGSSHRGRSNRDWQKLLGDLANDDKKLEQVQAALVIKEIYDEL